MDDSSLIHMRTDKVILFCPKNLGTRKSALSSGKENAASKVASEKKPVLYPSNVNSRREKFKQCICLEFITRRKLYQTDNLSSRL